MFMISKEFDLCYGHRVHNQTLLESLSISPECKCRHLHGHQGKIIVKLASEDLTNGMVTDFHHLNWFKKWVDDYFDHKMILDIADPYLKTMISSWILLPDFLDKPSSFWDLQIYKDFKLWTPILERFETLKDCFPSEEESQAFYEILEGLVIVNFVPTSENFAKFFSNVVALKLEELLPDELKSGIWIPAVEFKETPKTSSIYAGGY